MVERFEPTNVDDIVESTPTPRRAFRWQSHRGFLGFVLGALVIGS